MKYLQLLLWPFSLLYGSIMAVRNVLYDKGILASTRFNLPVIAVGNLTVGGTGKTPHVEYLLRLLRYYQLATLSRGYKRKSKGFVLADSQATPAILGDEPFQYHRDFPGVTVAVCEDRVQGIKALLASKPEPDVIVLDDAMQHRPVQPSLNLLITDYNRPFYRDLVMPAGLLREPKRGAQRADAIIVSKCPLDLSQAQKQSILKSIKPYTKSATPVYFSAFTYGNPVGVGLEQPLTKNILLLTGIANAVPFKEYLLSQQFNIVQHLEFPDHHQYTLQDMLKLKQQVELNNRQDISIITTSKDAVKLTDETLLYETRQLPLFYIPIEVTILGDGAAFDHLILNHVRGFKD